MAAEARARRSPRAAQGCQSPLCARGYVRDWAAPSHASLQVLQVLARAERVKCPPDRPVPVPAAPPYGYDTRSGPSDA